MQFNHLVIKAGSIYSAMLYVHSKKKVAQSTVDH